MMKGVSVYITSNALTSSVASISNESIGGLAVDVTDLSIYDVDEDTGAVSIATKYAGLFSGGHFSVFTSSNYNIDNYLLNNDPYAYVYVSSNFILQENSNSYYDPNVLLVESIEESDPSILEPFNTVFGGKSAFVTNNVSDLQIFLTYKFL